MRLVACLVAYFALAPDNAFADERPWYGTEIILADATADAFLIAGITADKWPNIPWTIGVAGQAAGPLIHLLHHEGSNATYSVLARTVLPLFGAAFGYMVAAGSCHDRSGGCGFVLAGGLIVGGTVGLAGAQAIDAAVIARHRPVVVPLLGHGTTGLVLAGHWR
jgi:hypothetical protein